MRRKSRKIYYGNIPVGGDSPITVQSMTNTKTADVNATVKQIKRLEKAGCEIIRVAVPDMESARKLSLIKKRISIPLIADIHFDYRLALEAIHQGVDGIRINPGNIGSEEKVVKVIEAAKTAGIPLRIGVNSGSIEKSLIEKYGGPTAEAMVESALKHVYILEKHSFYDIIISLKSTDIWTTVESYHLMAKKVDYPFHIGITEAGTPWSGTIKSSIGIGALLLEGLGDTLRVSLTGDPVEEVRVGWQILKLLNLRKSGPVVISCPTCGRTEIDLIKLAEEVEKKVSSLKKPLTIAVMGCAVNGPGEAKDADIGIAGGKGEGIIFKKGKLIKKVKEDELLDCLLEEINKIR
ncbi:flavodoxin-dependent (E)-4-hydroxy-3-methylbut-2-enyl-diphosphate synthase [Halothermothrix orenii]|uniref:4-hydroxy-3-methylbut-2-en-1-yl diphosphate synthase (flavodoxin) n=1 Tax=Halothermothrix orenii (strain H 168 / OCM 544 / DSM 9562) TaxID=373903 RepID=B8CW64_HALOH|nr:flavodoxin-dependent (E)-4-hydroxy-3-methylbut-2-enyl-diphosphate synthase [Halothermothrix orenii]ACL69533.1 1-hydroxy-2-methyl-2-(E)-butenyl 4-diphosphate synthase [Halothermothrix orenii H 168]